MRKMPCAVRHAPLSNRAISNFCASDYINPIDLCNRLNTYIVPEASVHAFLTFLFLINGYWVALILNLPLLAWNGKKYVDNAQGRATVGVADQVTGFLRTSIFWTRLRFSGN